jgi:hypothetical protein
MYKYQKVASDSDSITTAVFKNLMGDNDLLEDMEGIVTDYPDYLNKNDTRLGEWLFQVIDAEYKKVKASPIIAAILWDSYTKVDFKALASMVKDHYKRG